MRRITTCRRQHNYGQDVLVGIIDVNGFDFAHPDFLDADGHTRFEAIWDQCRGVYAGRASVAHCRLRFRASCGRRPRH
jgi:hypothetical protein